MMKRVYVASAVLALVASWVACSGDGPGTGGSTSGSTSVWDECYFPGEPCRTAEDCCRSWYPICGDKVCEQGVCSIDLVREPKSQVRGDCLVTRCDDAGTPWPEPAPDDVGDDGNPCTENLCYDNQPAARYEPKGPAPDGSGFCNGDGELVECVETSDCNDSSLLCSARFNCVPLHCTNREHDPSLGETDEDCGGPCDPCLRDAACNKDEDCVSLSCGADHTCIRPACDDGQKNGQEVDVDCGFYACNSRCPEGARCSINVDCTTGLCLAGKCEPRSCEDGVRNGDEEDVDCGGSDCPPCW